MTTKAALLDEQGIFLRIDTLDDDSPLTDRHLPQITECDLPAGRYVWMPAAEGSGNPYSGEFWPLPFTPEV